MSFGLRVLAFATAPIVSAGMAAADDLKVRSRLRSFSNRRLAVKHSGS